GAASVLLRAHPRELREGRHTTVSARRLRLRRGRAARGTALDRRHGARRGGSRAVRRGGQGASPGPRRTLGEGEPRGVPRRAGLGPRAPGSPALAPDGNAPPLLGDSTPTRA